MVNVKCIQSPKHLLYIKQKTTFKAANKPLQPAGNTAFSTRWPPLLPHQQNNQSYVTYQIWLMPTRKSVSSLRTQRQIILANLTGKWVGKIYVHISASVQKSLRNLNTSHQGALCPLFFSCDVALLHSQSWANYFSISFHYFFPISFFSEVLRFAIMRCFYHFFLPLFQLKNNLKKMSQIKRSSCKNSRSIYFCSN